MSSERDLEIRSSAVTLSDMEIFVFPDLMMALLLANLMSPRIWKWREDPWFAGLARMKPYRRITRLKQFIMDHYAFNLDLDTWGLTTKDREMARFRPFLQEDTIRRSNALFGYEGDKYYFDIDIRTHFGLNKYTADAIPYWKTETVEAMDAFKHKTGYSTGAGECVSLSALYAAALFIVAGIPLKDIFLMATPLHSQNYVDLDEGILTNNRRLVTKKMWCNGTALSAQARRALENEEVTVVAHETGWIHTVYPDATIDPRDYARFSGKLHAFLDTPLTDEVMGNFLRHKRDLQKCFQLRSLIHGVPHYVPLEVAFQYEEGSSFLITDTTRENLLAEIDMDQFISSRLSGRIVLNDLEDYVRREKPDLNHPDDAARLSKQFDCACLDSAQAIERLIRFCHVQPRIPQASQRSFKSEGEPLGIKKEMTRDEVIMRLESLRSTTPSVDLAFYVYRDLTRTGSAPFLKAALERNPVSIAGTAVMSDDEVLAVVQAMPSESIYDEVGRLAQPDEVWNYGRGDGVEKAILLAGIHKARHPDAAVKIEVASNRTVLTLGNKTIELASNKGLKHEVWDIT
ncbi:MAG: hypothetical protein WCO42_03605 [bacterium]